jgi:Holliday junction resolvasome RuvABC ATP-dependent DNA helicase subunit
MSLNLPNSFNPVDPAEFIGRENILDTLIESFKEKRSNSIYDIELLGPIGLGKTSR